MMRFSLDLDIATAAGTPVSHPMHRTAFNSYLKCAPQKLQSASVWTPDPALIQTWSLLMTHCSLIPASIRALAYI